MFQHPNGRHHEIRGHRLWVEQDGAGPPQLDFQRFAPRARFEMLERSGSFGHVEEPGTVLGLLREFWRTS